MFGTPTLNRKYSSWKKVQHRAAHWTTSSYNYSSSVTAMVDSLGWRTLDQRQAEACLCFFYKIVYGLVAVPLLDLIQQFPLTQGTVTPCLFVSYKHPLTITSIPFFLWLLSSGMPCLKLLLLTRPKICQSRSQ